MPTLRARRGAVKVSRSPKTTNRPGRTLTRASRAHSARSERSAEPCTATRRVRMLPDVMAVRPSALMTSCQTETAPAGSGKSAGRGRLLRASSDIDTAGRERPPQTMAWGRTGHATPGSFTPRFPSAIRARSHGGRHTAPSACDDLDAHNLLSRSVFWPTTLARSPRTLTSSTRVAVRVLGDKFAFGTCPPL